MSKIKLFIKNISLLSLAINVFFSFTPVDAQAKKQRPVLLMIQEAQIKPSENWHLNQETSGNDLREASEKAFKDLIKGIAPEVEILQLNVASLEDVPEAALARISPDQVIVSAYLFGHGSQTRYWLGSKTKYDGSQMAGITEDWMQKLPLSKIFTLMFFSCDLGSLSPTGTDGFSEVFTSELKQKSLNSTEVHVLTFPLATDASALTAGNAFQARMTSLVNKNNTRFLRKIGAGAYETKIMMAGLAVAIAQMILGLHHGSELFMTISQAMKEMGAFASVAALISLATSFEPKIMRRHIVRQTSVTEDELNSARQKITESLSSSLGAVECQKTLLGR